MDVNATVAFESPLQKVTLVEEGLETMLVDEALGVTRGRQPGKGRKGVRMHLEAKTEGPTERMAQGRHSLLGAQRTPAMIVNHSEVHGAKITILVHTKRAKGGGGRMTLHKKEGFFRASKCEGSAARDLRAQTGPIASSVTSITTIRSECLMRIRHTSRCVGYDE